VKDISRQPGFYKLSVEERRRVASRALEIDAAEMTAALDQGGLDPQTADKIIENVIGTYALPFALGLNFRVNGRDYLVPMVVEEPSVVAAASNAAKMIRAGGGFSAEVDDPIMIGQVQVENVKDTSAACVEILNHKEELIQLGNQAIPDLLQYGGGVRGLEVRELPHHVIVVHLFVDCRDAMGANMVNTVCESVSDRIGALSGGEIGLRILSNLCDRRKVRVTVRVPPNVLASTGFSGECVRDRIVRASRFAESDPYRATTHNKGVMNGIDAVVIATGNDFRAVEAGAHAYAARGGCYRPLCTFTTNDEGDLVGSLEIPLALGIVGGSTRVHQGARMALKILNVKTANELAQVVASVGLASNLAALRALSTEGIQRGHMTLHARSVAIAAGAKGSQVELVADKIRASGQITPEAAERVLKELSKGYRT
jgi:hydroxymethylglutaryl-CoA reductase